MRRCRICAATARSAARPRAGAATPSISAPRPAPCESRARTPYQCSTPGSTARRARPNAASARPLRLGPWVSDRRWPDLVHPFASTIDTPLLAPPECEHIMLGSKAGWVRIDARRTERRYDDYPQDSLEDWHRRHGLLDDG